MQISSLRIVVFNFGKALSIDSYNASVTRRIKKMFLRARLNHALTSFEVEALIGNVWIFVEVFQSFVLYRQGFDTRVITLFCQMNLLEDVWVFGVRNERQVLKWNEIRRTRRIVQ